MATRTSTTKASSNGHKRVIDYNQIKAAKAEVDREPVFLKIGKETVELPAEFPIAIAFLSADGRHFEAIAQLLGDNAELFWDTKPTEEQLTKFWNKVAEEYGLGDEGE